MATMNATDFKAKCLAVLDRVQETGERVIILKRGRPVAELSPATNLDGRYPQDSLNSLKKTVIIKGDIVSPTVPETDWEALKQ